MVALGDTYSSCQSGLIVHSSYNNTRNFHLCHLFEKLIHFSVPTWLCNSIRSVDRNSRHVATLRLGLVAHINMYPDYAGESKYVTHK